MNFRAIQEKLYYLDYFHPLNELYDCRKKRRSDLPDVTKSGKAVFNTNIIPNECKAFQSK